MAGARKLGLVVKSVNLSFFCEIRDNPYNVIQASLCYCQGEAPREAIPE